MESVATSKIRSGNYHSMQKISLANQAEWSATIDGEAYAQIYPLGIHYVHIGTAKFVPIKLTPNWLVGLGCRPLGGQWWNKGEGGYNEFNFKWTAEKGFEWCGISHAPKFYVHEFQNLYHEITGKELVLDLNLIKTKEKSDDKK